VPKLGAPYAGIDASLEQTKTLVVTKAANLNTKRELFEQGKAVKRAAGQRL
jgi:hypothetical protein